MLSSKEEHLVQFPSSAPSAWQACESAATELRRFYLQGAASATSRFRFRDPTRGYQAVRCGCSKH